MPSRFSIGVVSYLAIVLSLLLPAAVIAEDEAWRRSSNLVELEELMPKVFLAYGGREALLSMERNYTLLGERQDLVKNTSVHWKQCRKGQALRIDVDAGNDAAPVTTVFDGTVAFKATGKIAEELPEEQAALLKLERDNQPSMLCHFQDQGYTFKLVGRTTYHATPVLAIEAKHGSDEPCTLYIDDKNYLVDALSYKVADTASNGTSQISMDFAQYRPAGGTMVAFTQTQYVNDKAISELKISSVDTSTAVEASQFRRPDKCDIKLDHPVVLPFEYAHKEILVRVSLNQGEPLDFLFDTAASQTVVDRRVAAESFLDRGPNYNVTAAGGSVPTQLTSIAKLTLGDVALDNVQALILDLTPQTSQMGKRIAGIIGANVLNKFAVTIDFPRSQITLHDADSYKPPVGAVTIPFAQKNGPLVRAQVNGVEVAFLVDTGAAFNNLPTRIAKKFLNGQSPHMTEGTGVDGRPVRLATLSANNVKLGTQLLRGINFTYALDQESKIPKGIVPAGDIGVLGNPFWQNFCLTMDYKFQRLVLQPNGTLTVKQEIDQLVNGGDVKLTIHRDLRAAESAYQRALMKVQAVGDARLQARVWGRIGNLRRIMAKDLSRPEQARVAYEYFSKAQELAHKLQDRESEGRILADWSLLYLDNGQVQAAQQALQGATLYAPQDPQVNVDFAVYLYKMQMYPDMQKYVEKALFLDPSNWQALWYKVKLAEMFGDVPQQKETLKEILKYYSFSKIAKDKLAILLAPPGVLPPQGQPSTGAPAPHQ